MGGSHRHRKTGIVAFQLEGLLQYCETDIDAHEQEEGRRSKMHHRPILKGSLWNKLAAGAGSTCDGPHGVESVLYC